MIFLTEVLNYKEQNFSSELNYTFLHQANIFFSTFHLSKDVGLPTSGNQLCQKK